jgi:hypothetical protein
LQQAGKQAAQTRRDLFHGQRSAHAPLPAHADSEQRAQNHEGGEIGRQAGCHLDHGVEHQVEHQRQPPAVAVRQQAKQKCAHGAEGQSDGQGGRHFLIGFVEFAPNGGQAHDHQEEIERIQGPAEKSRQHGGAMAAGRLRRSSHVQAILA